MLLKKIFFTISVTIITCALTFSQSYASKRTEKENPHKSARNKSGIENLCLKCHETPPHAIAEKMAPLLNMHTAFMVCEVCHVRAGKKTERLIFKWLDIKTGAELFKIEGDPGQYGAKIVVFKVGAAGKETRLDNSFSYEEIKNRVEKWKKIPVGGGKVKGFRHKGHTTAPILCNECHKKGGYLDFKALHYSKKRAEELYGPAITEIVEIYLKDYLPTMFDPELVEKRLLLKEKQKDVSDEDVFDLGME